MKTLILIITALSPMFAQSLGFPGPGTFHSTPSGITLVAHACGVPASGDSYATSAVTVNTVGANFVVISYTGGGVATITDSLGNTVTPLTFRGPGSSSQILYVQNATSGTHVFTATASAFVFPTFCAAAFSGMLTSGVYDSLESGGNATSSTSVQPGSITPSAGSKLVVTALAMANAGTASINSSFTLVDSALAINNQVSWAYVLQPSGAGSVNPTWAVLASNDLNASIASFRGQ
jgi:hypothetical protein